MDSICRLAFEGADILTSMHVSKENEDAAITLQQKTTSIAPTQNQQ